MVPGGRLDLELSKFVDAILQFKPIDTYNNVEMYLDLTYVNNLVEAIRLLAEHRPVAAEGSASDCKGVSPAGPCRVINFAKANMVRLTDFIAVIEETPSQCAIRNYRPMQISDVPTTLSDSTLLKQITGFRPSVGH